jgi:hypothetical protein
MIQGSIENELYRNGVNGQVYLVVSQAQMNAKGTAVVLVNVARRSNRPVNCPVRPGNCPGARRVWRGICKVGCGCLCDRVTMMKGFERINH